jgi:primosomal protein N' (replication factor Y) (superfamily II helicase)
MPSDHASSGLRVSVMIPLPLGGAYDYLVPDGMAVAPGSFVEVPLGRRDVAGVVWGPGGNDVAPEKLKPIRRRLDVPTLPEVSRKFVDWVAAYTLYPPGAVLKMVMSVPAALQPPEPVRAYVLGEADGDPRMTPARKRVIEVAADGLPRRAVELAREAAVGTGVVRGLAAVGALRTLELLAAGSLSPPDWRHAGPRLSADQEAAAADLAAKVRGGGFGVTLLDGVPGSGKTEVYFQAVAETLRKGRQVLVLLPEIALGAQWLARFRERFGGEPAEWHSDMTGARRRTTWRDVAAGGAQVVVGARSALFLPFPDLGLIVVDEEHDGAFKQEDGVVYNARDMAVVRGRLGQHPVVLVSATPCLETVQNVEAGRYAQFSLPARHGGAAMPEVTLIDMRHEAPARDGWLTPPLRQAVEETIERGEQAMLFLNRRGYAPLTLCRACGHRLQCPRCTAWLVEHRRLGRLQCHHCDFSMRLPEACPSCAAEDKFAACGPGIERLAEEAEAAFPEARQALAASDTITGPRAAEELVRRIEAHDIDLLIGTQIVAKGYHFPLLTTVGVIDGDLGLAGGDLRAAERTYQLLYQVAGRAGRAERPGRVLVQTCVPDDKIMRALASGRRGDFVGAEMEERRAAAMPPFGRLAALVVSGRDEETVDQAARDLARAQPRLAGLQILGPARAPLALLRGRHRRRFLIKAPREARLQSLMRPWLASVRVPGSVRVQVDIDPYSFF